jgi:hypothetical protein
LADLNLHLSPSFPPPLSFPSFPLTEKIDYFAHDKKVARHEATRRYQLLALKSPIDPATGKAGALLPIDTDTPESIGSSPLVPLAVQAAETGMDEDDAVSALMNGTGPWLLGELGSFCSFSFYQETLRAA